MEFKKYYNLRILSLFVTWLLFLNGTIYAIDLPGNACLRPSLLSNTAKGKSRLREGNSNSRAAEYAHGYPANAIVDAERYKWGSGYFVDIADIRRRVYTDYYTGVEHYATMKEVLRRDPRDHCVRLFNEIEAESFDINRKNYEEIKLYLWQRAQEEFPDEVASYLKEKDRLFSIRGQLLLSSAQRFLEGIDLSKREDWRRVILFAIALNLFDVLKHDNYDTVTREIQVMLEQENTPFGINLAIDFSDLFFSTVLETPQRIVVLPGDLSSLAFDLKLYGEMIIERWLTLLKERFHIEDEEVLFKMARDSGISIVFLVNGTYSPRNNNNVVQYNAVRSNIETALSFKGLERLRLFKEKGLFEVASFSSPFSGTVLTDLDEKSQGIIKEADKVIALGEQNNITVNGLKKDCFRMFPIRDFISIFYAGIKNNTEDFKYPQFAFLYAPSGIMPAIDYEPDFPSTLTAKQYYDIYRILSVDQWNRLIDFMRSKTIVNIIEAALSSDILTGEQRDYIKEHFLVSNEQNIKIANEHMREFGGFYNISTVAAGDKRMRVMYVVHFNEKAINATGQRLTLGVLFANEVRNYEGEAKSKITYNDLIKNIDDVEFGFNFLYFITRNILRKFNEVNPHFILDNSFFGEGIGFSKFKQGDKWIVCPPLYNKGAVGVKKDGTFVFGRIRMPNAGSITIPINNEDVTLKWECVNPLDNFGYRISIFTPMEERFADLTKRAPNFFGETRAMYFIPDNDNYNFVTVNDILVGVVKGRTEIPPFGVVLSVPPDYFSAAIRRELDRWCEEVKLSKKLVDKSIRVSFDIPLDSMWDECAWIMGGALLMVNEGNIEDLDYNPEKSRHSVYHEEGWALESSQRTQETPVETNLNEARMTIGLTYDDEFFMVAIEGRANNRTGATHQQTVQWIQEYFAKIGKKVRFALDIDSASSVSLGLVANGKFRLLNQTARGSDSKLGDIRYYNHVAYLRRQL